MYIKYELEIGWWVVWVYEETALATLAVLAAAVHLWPLCCYQGNLFWEQHENLVQACLTELSQYITLVF